MSGHVGAEVMVAFVHGDLSAAELETLSEHCTSCKECGDQLAALLSVRRSRRQQNVRHARTAVAAFVVLTLVGLALGVRGFGTGLSTSAPTESDWAELATSEGPDPRLVRRIFGDGLPADTDTRLMETRTAFEHLVNGRLEQAIEILRGLYLERSADDVAAYLGIALYLSGQADEVVEGLLRQGVNSSRTADAHYSQWYLANHFLRLGDPQSAESILQDLAKSSDRPGRFAAELLLQVRPGKR